MTITLSDSARIVLSNASQHDHGIATAAKTLPVAARNAVFKSLIKRDLLIESTAPRELVGLAWRQDEEDGWIVARITDEGLRAIGIDPNEGDANQGEPDACGLEGSVPDSELEAALAPVIAAPQEHAQGAEAAQDAPPRAPRANLKDAAAGFLAAWDACPYQDATDNAISRAVAALRDALAPKPARATKDAAPRAPREGTKRETVIALLQREDGATVDQIMEATGWQAHTVRGFFAGLKKKGMDVAAVARAKAEGGKTMVYRV